MIQFSWLWMLLLLPLPLLLRSTSARREAAIAIPPSLVDALNTLNTSKRHLINWQMLLPWLAWIALVVALAQPYKPGDTVVQAVSGRAIALTVDVSPSMKAKDFTLDGETRDRLTVVKQIARDFILNRGGDRLSLVLYGKETFIASPLTFDLTSLASILDSAGIGMAGKSTRIGDAIGMSIQTLQNDPATSKAIVLLSDGTNLEGAVEPEEAAVFATSLGIRIHTIALGSTDKATDGYSLSPSADLDEQTLKEIARLGQGQYFRAASTEQLTDVYKTIDTLERAEVDAPPVVLKHDLRAWPLGVLLVSLLFLAWRRSYLS